MRSLLRNYKFKIDSLFVSLEVDENSLQLNKLFDPDVFQEFMGYELKSEA